MAFPLELIWLAVALPVAGFLINGALALWRPQAKRIVSVVGAGVLVGAFAVALGVWQTFRAGGDQVPYLLRLWSWLPVPPLQVDIALQVDQLSLVMLLVVTGVGSLIHLFSIGYMHADEGYARFFAYLNLFVVFMRSEERRVGKECRL